MTYYTKDYQPNESYSASKENQSKCAYGCNPCSGCRG